MRFGLCVLFVLVIFMFAGIGFAASGFIGNVSACGDTITATGVTGNASTNFTINKSAVTTPVFNQTTTGACIIIAANDTILDLNGTVIQLSNGGGSPAGTNIIYGIIVQSSLWTSTNSVHNITIKNGFINVSDNFTMNRSVSYVGIFVNGSANVTISNVTITSFGFDPNTTVGIAINITNISHNNSGYVNVTGVNITNVTTGGIAIANSSAVNITSVWFDADTLSAWNTASYAISSVGQNTTMTVNVTTSMFNRTNNLSMLFYQDVGVYLQPTRPISTAPTGTSNSNGARTFLDKMINISITGGTKIVNITFWFTASEIVAAPDTLRLAIYRTGDSVTWDYPLTAIPNSVSAVFITALNVGGSGTLVLFGDTSADTAHSTGTATTSALSDVPSPTLEYSCENNKITVKTLPDLRGGSVKMQYYCGSVGCGTCNGEKVGGYTSTINSDGAATFDYSGAGEYQFEVTAVGSSTTYRPTSWYNSGWSCYKPDAGCAVAEQPTPAPEAEQPATEQPATPPAEQPAPQPEQPIASTAREGALNAISDASNAIEVAQNANRNIAPARQKLQEASTAFASEDYPLATELANAAVQLAQAAPAKPSAPAAAQVPTAPKPVQATPAPNNTMLYLGVIVLVVVIAAAYLLFGRGKAKKGI